MVGRRGVADTFIVAGEGCAEYTGYADGHFSNPEQLGAKLKSAVADAEETTREPITKLYVGVPTDFCRAVVGESTISFDRPHRVSENDVAELFDNANRFRDDKSLRLINKAPVYYTTDDDRKIADPLGVKVIRIKLRASFLYAETAFVDVMNDALGGIGIGSVEYLCTPLAELRFLFESDERTKPVMLVDVGSGNTSVIVGQGEGVLSLTSFACGGAFFAADLSMCFHVGFDLANQLKSQVVLSLDAGIEDKYMVVFHNKPRAYSAMDVNEIIGDRLVQIADLVKRCIDTNAQTIPATADIYLTGGGLLHLRGAKDAFAKLIGRNVVPLAPKQPLLDKPECSQVLSLLDLALDINNY